MYSIIWFYFAQLLNNNQKRHLNLLEYQSKNLLQESGVAIQNFRILDGSGHDKEVLNDFGEPYFIEL